MSQANIHFAAFWNQLQIHVSPHTVHHLSKLQRASMPSSSQVLEHAECQHANFPPCTCNKHGNHLNIQSIGHMLLASTARQHLYRQSHRVIGSGTNPPDTSTLSNLATINLHVIELSGTCKWELHNSTLQMQPFQMQPISQTCKKYQQQWAVKPHAGQQPPARRPAMSPTPARKNGKHTKTTSSQQHGGYQVQTSAHR